MTTLAPKLPWQHAFAGGFSRLGGQALPTDADAIDYLDRVKAADGGVGVEVGVAQAIDAFVKGCKADNANYAGDPTRTNWDALQACCIMAGARTISGALVPLKTPYGPELVDIDNLPTPTIEDYDGSVGAWDAITRTASDTSPLTVTVSYPRFKFPFPSVVAGKQYRVSGRLSGNLDVLYQGKGLRLGSTYVSAVDPVTGVFDSVITQSGYAGLELVFDGSPLLSSVTIESLSIREDSFTPTAQGAWTASDYSRGGSAPGMKGNGTSLYLDTNRAGNADGRDDNHAAAWVTTADSNTAGAMYLGAGGPGIAGSTNIGATTDLASPDTGFRAHSATLDVISGSASSVGLLATSRSDGSSFSYRSGSLSGTKSRSSEVPASANYYVFARNVSGSPSLPTNARISFYSIGSALDLAALDSRTQHLMNSIRFTLLTGLSPDYDPATLAYLLAAYTAGASLT